MTPIKAHYIHLADFVNMRKKKTFRRAAGRLCEHCLKGCGGYAQKQRESFVKSAIAFAVGLWYAVPL
ncbi:MAG: hypothetical protein E7469_09330 [Ruminococcaceae bacterium]|nr:hypothetical protein [Oscillospiraceae bacterium]